MIEHSKARMELFGFAGIVSCGGEGNLDYELQENYDPFSR